MPYANWSHRAITQRGITMSSIALSLNNVDLVSIDGGNIFTTSIAIAEGTGNTHQAILKLLSKHQARFNKSQRVGFEIQSFETKGGVQTRSIAKLDERQAYLLMTMLRNTEKVMDFKEALIDAFLKARDLLNGNIGSLLQRHNAKLGVLKKGEKIASDCGYNLRLFGQVINPKTRAELKDIEQELQPILVGFKESLAELTNKDVE